MEKKVNEAIIPEVLDDSVVTVFDKAENVTGFHAKRDNQWHNVYMENDKIPKNEDEIEDAVYRQLNDTKAIEDCSPTLQQIYAKGRGVGEEVSMSESEFKDEKPWDVRMKELFAELKRLHMQDAVKEDKSKKAIVWIPATITPKFHETITFTQVQVESITIMKNGNTVFYTSQKLSVMQQSMARNMKHDMFKEADTWAKKEYKFNRENGVSIDETYVCKIKYDQTFAPNYKGFGESITAFNLKQNIRIADVVKDDLRRRQVIAEREVVQTGETIEALVGCGKTVRRHTISRARGSAKAIGDLTR
jgi:hypothetical protein